MEKSYTELIEELRRIAKTERILCLEDTGVVESGHADLIDAAADAIETLRNNGEAQRERISELDELCCCYCNERDELKARFDDLRAERAPDPAANPALSVLYLCDRRACDRCNPDCYYTADVRHAKHFEVEPYGGVISEQEG